MTRQRIRPSLKRSIYEDCHNCGGAGVVKTAESMAIDVIRLLALATHREEIRRIAISVNPNVATYLGNRKRKEITRFETECNMTIQIGFEENAPAERFKIECFDANGNEVRLFPARPPAPGAGTDSIGRESRTARFGATRSRDRARRPFSGLATDSVSVYLLRNHSMTFQPAGGYPLYRPRRLRGHPGLRDLVRETQLTVQDLIYPLFVYHGKGVRREIASMPGQFQLSLDRVGETISQVAELGIPAIILFGIPEQKDARGTSAVRDDGIVQEAIRIAKRVAPGILVITDLCFCEYTDHGHCGPIVELGGRVDVDNDATLPLLAEQSVSHARAGADMIAPSGMIDGMVRAIRSGLDEAGFKHLPIMSYAAKFASGFYGPFRDAAESAPSFGDRRTYQMDPANATEALREVALDLAEGADIVMVKPALAYLDIIRRVAEMADVPVAAYNVSGEYAMVKAAAANGWIDERRMVLEILTGIKRAGADMILTYHALDVARWLRHG